MPAPVSRTEITARDAAPVDRHLDRVLLLRVVHRVLDQGVERDLEPVGVGDHRRLLGGSERAIAAAWPSTGGRHPSRSSPGRPPRDAGTRGPRLPASRSRRSARRRSRISSSAITAASSATVGSVALALDQLRVAERDRDRRAQLVRGVLHEPLLALEQAEVRHGHPLGLLHRRQATARVPHHRQEHRRHERHLGELVERLVTSRCTSTQIDAPVAPSRPRGSTEVGRAFHTRKP